MAVKIQLMFTYPWVFALFFFFQKSHISIPNLVLRPSKSMPHALSISFPNINFLHSILYLFVYLSIGLFFLHTFVHGVLTSFLLTKFYPLFMPHFKFFLLYKMILKYFSPIFTLFYSIWHRDCLTTFRINYSLPYERSINIEASFLELYCLTSPVITETFLIDSVCFCICVLTGNSNKT